MKLAEAQLCEELMFRDFVSFGIFSDQIEPGVLSKKHPLHTNHFSEKGCCQTTIQVPY